MIKDYRQLMLLSKRGLSIRQIARMAGCKWETARDALERMKAAYGSLEAIPISHVPSVAACIPADESDVWISTLAFVLTAW